MQAKAACVFLKISTMQIDRNIKYALAGILIGFLLRGNVRIGQPRQIQQPKTKIKA